MFTDADGNFGNPLGWWTPRRCPPPDRQRLATEWVTAKRYSSTSRRRVPPARTRASTRRHRVGVRRTPDRGRGLVAGRTRDGRAHPWRFRPGSCRSDATASSPPCGPARTGRRSSSPRRCPSVSELMAADPAEYPRRRLPLPVDLAGPRQRDHSGPDVRQRTPESSRTRPPGRPRSGLTDHLSRDLAITQGKGRRSTRPGIRRGGSRWPGASSATASARSGERSAGGGDAVGAQRPRSPRSKSSAEENDRYTEAKRR